MRLYELISDVVQVSLNIEGGSKYKLMDLDLFFIALKDLKRARTWKIVRSHSD